MFVFVVSVIKTVSVDVYLDGDVVGSGEVRYTDNSSLSFTFRVDYVCDVTPVVDDNGVEVGHLEFCRSDKVASGFGGRESVSMSVPVYVGNSEVGVASLAVEDEYSAVLWPIAAAALLLILMVARLK